MKSNSIKKVKSPLVKPEENSLEKEFDQMIDREKTRIRIVNKLLNQKKPTLKKFDSS